MQLFIHVYKLQLISPTGIEYQIVLKKSYRIILNHLNTNNFKKVLIMNILETSHLTFNYRNHSVLEDINLKIPEGSIYGYLGKNGEGKSTTIKILLGLEQTKINTVFFNKKEFHSNRLHILQNIGCLIEHPFFYADLSAYENLNYLDILYHCGQKRIQEVLELVNLTKDKDKKVRKYSTGMKQRLGIAMAMFHNPKLLILDEPLNGLDPQGVFEMRELMLKLKSKGKTIFISGHILAEMEKICTHIGILNNKRLLFQGEINSLLNQKKQSYLIHTDQPERCMKICKEHLIPTKRISDGTLIIELEQDGSFDSFKKLMQQNHIQTLFADTYQENLESVFLHLIKTDL